MTTNETLTWDQFRTLIQSRRGAGRLLATLWRGPDPAAIARAQVSISNWTRAASTRTPRTRTMEPMLAIGREHWARFSALPEARRTPEKTL